MKPNGVLAALARRVAAAFSFLCILGLVAGAALAGDRADLNLLGYSPDGRYFAFEEYGVQDGSGFAYSTVHVIDLTTDTWLAGAPFKALAEDEMASVEDMRAKNLAGAAGKALDTHEIGVSAAFLAMIGDGDRRDDETLDFGVPSYGGPGAMTGDYRLTLESFAADAAEPCPDYMDGERAKGYALTLSSDGVARELHRDTSIPKSRACPTAYRLYGVVIPGGDLDLGRGVALISVYMLGFEGPDRRFIAVPIGPRS